MTQEATEIEVEVVEIDGIAPTATPPHSEPQPRSTTNNDWRQWQGRVRQLDSRWWPLWVVLGIIALALVLTVGLVIGAIVLVFRILQSLVRAIQR